MRSRPLGVVVRTARVCLGVTPAQSRRCFGLLRSGGDVWAWVLDCNRTLRQWRYPPVVSYQGLCRELAGMGVPFGELSATAARSVLRRYSDAWFAAAAGRAGQGRPGGFPRRKRALMPLRWYAGTFILTGRRLRLSVAAGRPPLVVRLARPVPYPDQQVRSVTLVVDGGRLAVDVTAEVPVQVHDLDPARVAGVDMGIIHPYAVVSGADALLVSGRAARAEHHLHLVDTKARSRATSRRAPTPGRRRSRRWRQARRAQRTPTPPIAGGSVTASTTPPSWSSSGRWPTKSPPWSSATPKASPPVISGRSTTAGCGPGTAPTCSAT